MRVPARAGAHVDEHVADLEHLLAVLVAQLVRRLGAHHAQDVALARLDDEALGEHHVPPPAPERQELDEAVLADRLDHEAHLVEVPGQHDAGPVA